MFLTHFALTAHPFAEKPPIAWLERDPRIDEALARLKFFEQQGAIALITGQTGVGKSSLLRLFIQELPQNRYHPLYLHLTPVCANAFLRLMVTKLGEKPKMGKDRMLLQVLDRIQQHEKCTLLIIDEAHLIDPQTLTDLRLLISSIEDEISLNILFCGQENVKDILKRSSHADLVHRMPHRIALHCLTKTQTGTYIDSRITQAGGTNKTFEPEAKDLIHDYTGGVPRQINNVATACLINAASRNIKKINEPLVNETMGEFHLPQERIIANHYPDNLLRNIRNHVPIDTVVIDMLRLDLRRNHNDAHLRFRCPLCGRFHTATDSKTNLARCFDCEKNFNPIDLVMAVIQCGFVDAVEMLKEKSPRPA